MILKVKFISSEQEEIHHKKVNQIYIIAFAMDYKKQSCLMM